MGGGGAARRKERKGVRPEWVRRGAANIKFIKIFLIFLFKINVY